MIEIDVIIATMRISVIGTTLEIIGVEANILKVIEETLG